MPRTRSTTPSSLRAPLCALLLVLVSALYAAPASAQSVFINELHYDNAGADAGEAIEVAGPAGTSLAGWSIVLYNGTSSSRAPYNTRTLSGTIPDQSGNGYGTLDFTYPSNGIQNGSPDGLALVNASGQVVQFLSYEGTFTGASGPAAGVASTSIGVSETTSTPAGHSLQLGGSGSEYPDFAWNAPSAESFGQINANQEFGVVTPVDLVCGNPATPIHEVQGSGSTSPLKGDAVTIEAVVVGDFQGANQLEGFFVQEAAPDSDPATSEGLFVGNANPAVDVAVGDLVRVRGTVSESFGLTSLSGVSGIASCGVGTTNPPVQLQLPMTGAELEAFEGMSVVMVQTLTVSEVYNLARYGEVVVSSGGRLVQPTDAFLPGSAEAQALAASNRVNRLVIDDASTVENPDPVSYPAPGLSAENTLRVGYEVENPTGVLSFGFGAYRLQPTVAPAFTAANPRTEQAPEVGGTLRVVSFNILNYFNGNGTGGGFPTTRGADTPAEFARQKAKIVSALLGLNADVVGLLELENDFGTNQAVEDLVAALNAAAGAGTYRFINTGRLGTDQIRVGLFYKPAKVTPVGAHAVLTSAVDPRFIDTKSRPSLAQTFEEVGTKGVFTVVVNHLKSKGSDCDDISDPDAGDGQGNCNGTRTQAAHALVDWIKSDPTASNDPDVLLVGDFNAYRMEDPIRVFAEAGYSLLAPPTAYSYVFEAQSGSLDHALASASMKAQVTGAEDWAINATEPRALDYNVEFKSAAQAASYYSPGPYRSSDHDPLLIGLDLAPVLEVSAAPLVLWPANHKHQTLNVSNLNVWVSSDVSADEVVIAKAWSDEADDADGDGSTESDILLADGCRAVDLRSERQGGGNGRVYTLVLQVRDALNTATATYRVSVPHNGADDVAVDDGADAGFTVEGCEAPAAATPGSTGRKEKKNASLAAAPERLTLEQNYPNPFSVTATIHYDLPKAEHVRLVVFNMLGQEVARLLDGRQEAGSHTVSLDGSTLATGAYIYVLQAGSERLTRRAIVVR